jgi:hypothetical protein
MQDSLKMNQLDFWSGPVLDYEVADGQPWSSFYRFMSRYVSFHDSPAQSIYTLVDFDMHYYMWREMSYDNNVTRSGSWSTYNSSSPHVVLPELNLYILRFNDYATSCVWEPFVVVHRTTDNPSSTELQAQSDPIWSAQSDRTVVARTAGFGFCYSALDVCLRKSDYEADGEMQNGLGNEFVIVTGLLTATRSYGWQTQTRLQCDIEWS